MGARTVEELWLKKSVFLLTWNEIYTGPRCLMVMTSDFYRHSQDLEVAGSSPAGGSFSARPAWRAVPAQAEGAECSAPRAEAHADVSFGFVHAGRADTVRHYGSLSGPLPMISLIWNCSLYPSLFLKTFA